MPRVRKYLPGEPFANVHEAVDWILAGNYTFFRHKPMHSSWVGSWSLITIRNIIRPGGALRRAIINPDWQEPIKHQDETE